MPIVKPVMLDDPFGGLAWRACITNLALRKIRDRVPLDPEEHGAFTEFSKDASDLAKVAQQKGVAALIELEGLDGRLLAFYSLVGPGAQISRQDLDPNQLKEDLLRIVETLPSYPAVPMDVLERMQEAINELIERVNLHRPLLARSQLAQYVA